MGRCFGKIAFLLLPSIVVFAPSMAETGLAEQGVKACKSEMMDERWIIRGNDWYVGWKVNANDKSAIIYARSVNPVVVNSEQIKEGDTLNGIDWKGAVSWKATAWRETKGGTWGPWQNGPESMFTCLLRHEKGKWDVHYMGVIHMISPYLLFRPTDNQIPQ